MTSAAPVNRKWKHSPRRSRRALRQTGETVFSRRNEEGGSPPRWPFGHLDRTQSTVSLCVLCTTGAQKLVFSRSFSPTFSAPSPWRERGGVRVTGVGTAPSPVPSPRGGEGITRRKCDGLPARRLLRPSGRAARSAVNGFPQMAVGSRSISMAARASHKSSLIGRRTRCYKTPIVLDAHGTGAGAWNRGDSVRHRPVPLVWKSGASTDPWAVGGFWVFFLDWCRSCLPPNHTGEIVLGNRSPGSSCPPPVGVGTGFTPVRIRPGVNPGPTS